MHTDDDLDLSDLLTPVPAPQDGAARARRTVRRRRATRRGAGALVGVVAIIGAAVAIERPGDTSRDDVLAGPGGAPTITIDRTHDTSRGDALAGSGGAPQLVTVWREVVGAAGSRYSGQVTDLESGRSVPFDVPGSASDGGVELLARDGGVVIHRPGGGEGDVWFLAHPYTETPRPIARGLGVVPSIHPDRIWVIDEQTSGPLSERFTASMRELTLAGEETASVSIPCCKMFSGESAQGLVMTSDAGTEVIDPGTGAVSKTFPSAPWTYAVDRSSALYGVDDEACGIDFRYIALDLATGATDEIDGCFSSVAGFSPDGQSVALWQSGDGASASLRIVSLDDGNQVDIPNSKSVEYLLAWDGDARVFFAGDNGSDIWSHDLTTGESKVLLTLDDLAASLAIVP